MDCSSTVTNLRDMDYSFCYQGMWKINHIAIFLFLVIVVMPVPSDWLFCSWFK